jgi:DNA modification methylase
MTAKTEILEGDALTLFAAVASDSIDLLIADPPYNLGKNYGNNDRQLSANDYLDFSKSWISEAVRVLKPTGTIYVFMGVRFISYIYAILDRDLGLEFNSWITWHYTQGMGKKRGFSPRHDDVLMFNMSKNFTFNLDAVRVPQKYYRARNNMRGANPGDVWGFSHVHYCQKNRQPIPTQKPEALLERMILASSHEGDQILDPFAGSGTTLRVCQQLGREALGFEINPDYVEMSRERLDQPFSGFDGIDPRLHRVPKDLRDPEQRKQYLANHVCWFLPNHSNSLELFNKSVREMYGEEVEAER